MILLYGESGTGKTQWFLKQNKDYRILHCDNLKDLRTSITSVNSSLIENKPTLINTWFDLNMKDILDLAKFNVTIETHYYETNKGKKVVGSGKDTHYWGLKNEMLFKKIEPRNVIYFPPKKKNQKKLDMLEVFGALYPMIKSQFPEFLE